jgi:transposase
LPVRLRPRWKDQHRAQAVPEEFRSDVIVVARKGDQSIAQLARSFGVSKSGLARWLKIADRDDGSGPTPSAGAAGPGGELEAESRALRRRAKQLEPLQVSAEDRQRPVLREAAG